MREVKARFEALGKRLGEKELLGLADAPEPGAAGAANSFMNSPQFAAFIKSQIFNVRKQQFFSDEGAALLITPSQGEAAQFSFRARMFPSDVDTSSPMAVSAVCLWAAFIPMTKMRRRSFRKSFWP